MKFSSAVFILLTTVIPTHGKQIPTLRADTAAREEKKEESVKKMDDDGHQHQLMLECLPIDYDNDNNMNSQHNHQHQQMLQSTTQTTPPITGLESPDGPVTIAVPIPAPEACPTPEVPVPCPSPDTLHFGEWRQDPSHVNKMPQHDQAIHAQVSFHECARLVKQQVSNGARLRRSLNPAIMGHCINHSKRGGWCICSSQGATSYNDRETMWESRTSSHHCNSYILICPPVDATFNYIQGTTSPPGICIAGGGANTQVSIATVGFATYQRVSEPFGANTVLWGNRNLQSNKEGSLKLALVAHTSNHQK